MDPLEQKMSFIAGGMAGRMAGRQAGIRSQTIILCHFVV